MFLGRRQFLTCTFATAALGFLPRAKAASLWAQSSNNQVGNKAYGSGHFGEWIEDEFGLPAFHYTCDQINDPKAVTEVNPGILSSREHVHQVGNDRLVTMVSNYGHVRIRQDEGSPKFLNDYAPDRGCFGGGFGYLTDGKTTLSTFYPGGGTFDRIFGAGYFRKRVNDENYGIDQVIFAPFGDDPVLISQVTITNHGQSAAKLRWIEYWGCQTYQFSFRSFMEMFGGKSLHELRRDFDVRFSHHFTPLENNSGLIETKKFMGRSEQENAQWQGMLGYLAKSPNPFLTVPDKNAPKEASFDDLNPPATFLVSLDGPADGVSSNGEEFFGTGGVEKPSGLDRTLNGDLNSEGPESALLLERKIDLKSGESRTLTFLYGYLPEGFELQSLVAKYSKAENAWKNSSKQWKQNGLRFRTPSEPWVERELTWNYYYLRSGLTYDSFFHQHILSQASIYQYVMGFQGAARDPLQHVLPFIYSDPEIVKDILRYTLKEVRPDGSIPYGIVGYGMTMPNTSDDSSDMPMWLLWVVSEYVLATRDVKFLDEQIATVHSLQEKKSVRQLLHLCYRHQVEDVGVGEHGLMRMLRDDWNDALVNRWVKPNLLHECLDKGESVLNSAMAAYVFDYYATLLRYAGENAETIVAVQGKAEDHRKAVQKQWTGEWFRRAWLGPTQGWLGEKGIWLEPQPWTMLGGVASDERTTALVQSMNEKLRSSSMCGAIQLNHSPDMETYGPWKFNSNEVDGGVWPSLNATLIWALARINGEMAWEEWKRNSFAHHAETYPAIWYQVWSGPDVLNSSASAYPGETTRGRPFGWTDFPVFNMHTHACPLFTAGKLLGLEFTENGLILAPKLPLESYSFESKLFGFEKSSRSYHGWYNPSSHGMWDIKFGLPAEEAKNSWRIEVNGHQITSAVADGFIDLKGEGGGGHPLRWAISRA